MAKAKKGETAAAPAAPEDKTEEVAKETKTPTKAGKVTKKGRKAGRPKKAAKKTKK